MKRTIGIETSVLLVLLVLMTVVACNDETSDSGGAVRFDTKVEGGPLGEGGERYYNYVRLVRDAAN